MTRTRQREKCMKWHSENYSSPYKGQGWRYTLEKPEHFKAEKFVNQFCRQMWLQDGELLRCMAETKGGKTYCPDCEAERSQAPSGSRYAGVRSVGKWSHMS